MRLDEKTKEVIKNSVLKFDPDAQVYLFGSRTDDTKKGGDIDILIISNKINLSEKIKILSSIFDSIEEQKIDLVIAKSLNETPFIKYISHQIIPL